MNEKHSVDESRIWQFDRSVIQKHRNNTVKIYISPYFIDEPFCNESLLMSQD